MSAATESAPIFEAEALMGIATDLFETMVDGEPGHLTLWWGEPPELEDSRFTWVDIQGQPATRVLLAASRETGEQLTRALLALPEGSAVGDEDFADAVGEVANVVGGNIKSMVPDGGALTLPSVAHAAPDAPGAIAIIDTYLSWRGAPLHVSLWALP
ncbi:chemotaxis protein CheX [Demequina aestuarii]|uniref:chemotaxis protein CheX n=1 Tax=Demequina aestuarii TaxID=327095 RepID=UPI000781653F|nr:chemotaxis protein CheX [Demequina aestuarii]